jgi:hypothetical protein
MNVRTKNKILSFLFLLLFLFPATEKALHDVGHANDFHCSDNVTLHFHASEHDCSLCDFQVTPSTEVTASDFSAVTFSKYFDFIITEERSECADYIALSSARAPPLN